MHLQVVSSGRQKHTLSGPITESPNDPGVPGNSEGLENRPLRTLTEFRLRMLWGTGLWVRGSQRLLCYIQEASNVTGGPRKVRPRA